MCLNFRRAGLNLINPEGFLNTPPMSSTRMASANFYGEPLSIQITVVIFIYFHLMLLDGIYHRDLIDGTPLDLSSIYF